MTDSINRELLNEAILLLGRTYNDPKSKGVEHAISLLQKSLHSPKSVEPIRADQVTVIKENFIPTGVKWFDDWLRGGVRPQELILYGAIPHAGKTHLLTWTGAQFLLEGYKVLSVVGEDLLSDVVSYYDAALASSDALANLWLADMQDVRFGLPEIEEIFSKLKSQENTPEIIVIDHVDLMKGVSGKPDWELVSDIMAELKLFAKRTNTVVITASQANFPRETRGMERFYRAKVGKAANADIIIMVDDVIDDEYEVSLLKARGRKRIPTEEKQKRLLCNWDTMTITEAKY